MKDSNYIVTFTKSGFTLKVTYRQGILKKLERKKGTLEDTKAWNSFMTAIPQRLNDLTNIQKQFPQVKYEEVVEKKSTFKLFESKFLDFYHEKTNGVPYMMNAIEGKNLKDIITFLTRENGSEEKALELWGVILDNWNKLEKFYQDQFTIRQINRNLNNILTQIKYGGKSKATTDQRSKFSEGL